MKFTLTLIVFFSLVSPFGQANIDPLPENDLDRQFAQAECSGIVGSFSGTLIQFLQANRIEYEDLKKRVISKGASVPEFNLAIIKLLHTYLSFQPRILNSRLYEGQSVSDQFLRGVTLWASNLQDIFSAIEVCYHIQNAATAVVTARDDIDMQFFAARMAWLTERYNQTRLSRLGRRPDIDPLTAPFEPSDRRTAIYELDIFDESMAQDLNIHFNHRTFQVHIDNASQVIVDRVREKGLNVSDTPVTRLQLEYNNGRRADSDEIFAAEMWAARYLGEIFPGHFWLGLGDLSVRQFFPLLAVSEGYLSRYPKSVDFLTVSPHLVRGKVHFNIHELKFSSPYVPEVDVRKALMQITSTWAGLAKTYGHAELALPRMEIVVPRRDVNLKNDLGNGFGIGREFHFAKQSSNSELLENGKPVEVSITVDGVTLTGPVTIRQLRIKPSEFRRLEKASEGMDAD